LQNIALKTNMDWRDYVNSIQNACQPRPEILAGNFNPEVYTASLSPIIEFYQNGGTIIDNIYTDAELFFREATYPTQGLCLALAEIFGRIKGDLSMPAIHRLETAFGGGKTHALIACTHIAYRGTDLKNVVNGLLDHDLLPEPRTISVVGIAGDAIPVHKTQGDALVPYTLWGEMAYQIGGETLYHQVEDEANSFAAPGRTYFEKILSGRKVIIMLDELAQYAARLEAARSDGANQLAAFMMALHGYARMHSGISIVLTLASSTDAFGKQTERLSELLSNVRGKPLAEDDALNIGEKAVKGLSSVVARDAVQITPVQASEIASVLAKRLFMNIDRDMAHYTADDYMNMYQRNVALLPEEAASPDYRGRLIGNYPFHPTLLDLLNKKLAIAENFQGTRGVLRVLALAVRNLWQENTKAPMIHACHLDLRSERVVNEILGRTGSSELLFVLNADVGGVDTGSLEGGHSNAELADHRNPHPEKYPLYEFTWKTVLLHSLVGREEGLNSKIFGITEPEALFSVSFPGLTPPQVRTALAEIKESAFYLKQEQGRYFASEEPTINSILARIRKTLGSSQVENLLKDAARKVIAERSDMFHIEHDVTQPEDLPDGKNRMVLGVISLVVESIDVEAMITTKGDNKPRIQQNLVFVLVPDTCLVEGRDGLDGFFQSHVTEVKQELEGIARQVLALRSLTEKPRTYGVNPRRLEDNDFRNRKTEREQALLTTIASVYSHIYYPSATGYIVRKEIKTAGGEGGRPFIEQIREKLTEEGELLSSKNTSNTDLRSLHELFFEQSDTISIKSLRENFACVRRWPVLESAAVLEQIVREGVKKGNWCVYRMGAEENQQPTEIYHRENEVPMGLNLDAEGYGLITQQGANQRGWIKAKQLSTDKICSAILDQVSQLGSMEILQVKESVTEKYGEIPDQDFNNAIAELAVRERLYVYEKPQDSTEKPKLIYGDNAQLHFPKTNETLITPAKAAERGWIVNPKQSLIIGGSEGADKIFPILRRLGSLFGRGAKSTIECLDLSDLELSHGGKMRIVLSDASPATMKDLEEYFETLSTVVSRGSKTEIHLEISDPDDECTFIKEFDK